MPTPPPGASQSIYVTPPRTSPLPNLKSLPSPDLSRSLARTRQQTIDAANRAASSRQSEPRTPNPNVKNVTAPRPPGSTALPDLSQLRKPRAGGTSSSGSSISSSPPSSKSVKISPPPAGGAVGAAPGLGSVASLFWKGVGSGIGWEASRQLQGRKRDIVSEQDEQAAIQRAQAQRQQHYLSNPPYTEVVELERVPFEGGQSSGVNYVLSGTVSTTKNGQTVTFHYNREYLGIVGPIIEITSPKVGNAFGSVGRMTVNIRTATGLQSSAIDTYVIPAGSYGNGNWLVTSVRDFQKINNAK